jgi:hypothetical protein
MGACRALGLLARAECNCSRGGCGRVRSPALELCLDRVARDQLNFALASGRSRPTATPKPRAAGSGEAERLPWRVPVQSRRTRHGIPIRRGDDGPQQGHSREPRVAAKPEGSRDGSPFRADGPGTGSRFAAETMAHGKATAEEPRVAAKPEGSRGGSPFRADGPVTGSRFAAETMAHGKGATEPTDRPELPGRDRLQAAVPSREGISPPAAGSPRPFPSAGSGAAPDPARACAAAGPCRREGSATPPWLPAPTPPGAAAGE